MPTSGMSQRLVECLELGPGAICAAAPANDSGVKTGHLSRHTTRIVKAARCISSKDCLNNIVMYVEPVSIQSRYHAGGETAVPGEKIKKKKEKRTSSFCRVQHLKICRESAYPADDTHFIQRSRDCILDDHSTYYAAASALRTIS